MSQPPSPLDINALRRARSTARLGHTIHYFDSIDSTNTAAQRLAREGAAEGTVVIAEAQTQGRGRLGRSWESPPFRNLYASIVLRPPINVSAAPQITLVVGVAATEAIRRWAAQAAIKWPNDVLISGRKVCGILTEMEAAEEQIAFVVAGIGVNLNIALEEFPADLRSKAGSVSAATGAPIDRVAFAAGLLEQIEARYDLFVRDGFAAIRPLWEHLSSSTGRTVTVDDSGRMSTGVVTGIDANGHLHLRTAAGDDVAIVAGDVTVIDGYAARN